MTQAIYSPWRKLAWGLVGALQLSLAALESALRLSLTDDCPTQHVRGDKAQLAC